MAVTVGATAATTVMLVNATTTRKGINRPRGQRPRHVGDDLRHQADRRHGGDQVTRAARHFAGANPDLSTATAAVRRSAASLGATLTPGDIAIERIYQGRLSIGWHSMPTMALSR
jgi:hypothetical protein